MSIVLVEDTELKSIADAIRTGTGSTESILPTDMPTEIYKLIALIGGNEEMNVELLWTNESPKEEFAGITLNFEGAYKMFIVQCKNNTGNSVMGLSSIIIPDGFNHVLMTIIGLYQDFNGDNSPDTACYYGNRTCSATESSMTFGGAVSYKFGGKSEVAFSDNTMVIPYKVYGIK